MDDVTGTQDGQTPGDEGQSSTLPTANSGQTYTQEDFDKAAAAIRRKADAETKSLKAQVDELTAQIQGFTKSAEDKARADLSELERMRLERDEAAKERAAMQAEAEAAKVRALRADLIAEKIPTLPAAYKRLVTGDDRDAVAESIQEALEAHKADTAATVERLSSMTAEAIAEEFGDAGRALVERLGSRPGSVGSSAAGAADNAKPTDPAQGMYRSGMSLAEFRAVSGS